MQNENISKDLGKSSNFTLMTQTEYITLAQTLLNIHVVQNITLCLPKISHKEIDMYVEESQFKEHNKEGHYDHTPL